MRGRVQMKKSFLIGLYLLIPIGICKVFKKKKQLIKASEEHFLRDEFLMEKHK